MRALLRHTLRNPLRCDGSVLPAELVVAAKALALLVLLRGEQPFRLFLPYPEIMDSLGSPWGVQVTLRLAVLAGCGLIWVTRYIRLGCFLAGAGFLLGLLSCRPCLSVAHTYLACVFLVLSLSSRSTGGSLLRAQIVILYLGASLNKALDADWWSGRYFDTAMIDRYADALYGWIAARLPERWFGGFVGASTILAQIAIAVCFLRRRWLAAGITLAALFHGVMVLWLRNSFGPFYATLLFSYLALVPWPERIETTLDPRGAAGTILRRLDLDSRIRFAARRRAQGLVVGIGESVHRGARAAAVLIGTQPLTYFVLAVLLAAWPLGRPVELGTVAVLTLGAIVAAAHLLFAGEGTSRLHEDGSTPRPRGNPTSALS